MSRAPEVAMACRGLRKSLGRGEGRVQVLKGVDLDLEARQVSSVVGPSGCGKSTLLYLLGLLDDPDAGHIEVKGERVPQQRDGAHTRIRCEHIGFVFQFHFLLPEFSALENVMLPMRKLALMEEEAMRARAESLLGSVGLGDKGERRPSQLSGGEQQRVAVARALANRPSVLLADEPTGNLDVKNSQMVFDLLSELAREYRQAVLIVTHNPVLAESCDRILRMEDGVFVA